MIERMEVDELKNMCKTIRKTLKFSQQKLAEIIDTTQTEISFIEHGFIPPNTKKVEVIKNMYQNILKGGDAKC